MVIDVLMGTLISLFSKKEKYNSRIWVNGFIRKIGYLAIVVAVDLISNAVMKDGETFRIFITTAFIFYEFSSIFENYIRAGGKVPKSLQKFVDNLAASAGENKDDEDKKKPPN